MNIIKAHLEDISALDILTLQSKASWGYSQEDLISWKEDLKLHPDDITENHTYIGKENNTTIGYTTFVPKQENRLYLKNLFIHPNYLRKGYGGKLLDFVVAWAKNNNYTEIYLESDPHAEIFYKNYGFFSYDKKESSQPNRFLPLMKIHL